MSLPFLPIASERSPSRRPRECRAPPPTRGVPTKRRRPVLTTLDRVFWITLRRWWSGWRDPLVYVQADTVTRWQREPVSQVLGPLVQLSSPATRPARYGLADSPIDRANGDGQSIVACATDSWRIEDAGHRHLRAHRLAPSAPASPATQSDVEDLSSQSSESNGLDRFLYRAYAHPESVVCVHRTGASASPCAAFQCHRASHGSLDRAADCGGLRGPASRSLSAAGPGQHLRQRRSSEDRLARHERSSHCPAQSGRIHTPNA